VVSRRDLLEWEHQPLKIGCTNKGCPGYLRPIDERAPFSEIPRWSVDRKTKYRLAERGKRQGLALSETPGIGKVLEADWWNLLRFVGDNFTGCDLRRVWEQRD
jgi:hypothetical protein